MKTRTMWLMTSLATLALGAACGDKKSGNTPADTAVSETTVNETSVSETSVSETSVNETSVSETSVSETSVNETSVNETSVSETSVNETTVSETETTTTVSCDFNGLTSVFEQFGGDEGGSSYYGFAEGDGEYVRIAFFPPVDGSSPNSPLDGPGDYVIGGNADDLNWRTCTTCVLAARECDPITGDCAKWYYAVSGTIRVTELDYAATSIVGTLEDAKLQEVTIDWEGDLSSAPVNNGKGWCFDSYAFSTKPECVTSADCTEDPARTICDDYNACVECAENADCTADPSKTTCSYGSCVECTTSFECKTAAKPVCGDGTCVASTAECSGDDAYEENDGPTQASSITLATKVSAGICEGTSGDEIDYYLVNTTEVGRLTVAIAWTDDVSIGLRVVDSTGASAGGYGSQWSSTSDSWLYASAPAGRYYVVVSTYDTMSVGNGTAAVPYDFTVNSTPPECATDPDCKDAARPYCNVDAGLCDACKTDLECTVEAPRCVTDESGDRHVCGVSDFCTGDDARENGDDGPKGATPLRVGDSSADAKVCGDYSADSSDEADWYVLTIAAGVNATASLEWQADASDLDLYLLDATLKELDSSEFAVFPAPESIDLKALAAGTYYLVVQSFSGAPTDAVPYTLSVKAAATP